MTITKDTSVTVKDGNFRISMGTAANNLLRQRERL